MKNTKKIVSIGLIACVIISLVTVLCINMNKAPTTDAGAYETNGLAKNVQDGQILQCWNWSFENMRKNMSKIAEQGFSAVQTSPIQGSKETTKASWSTMSNSWWVYYQPINFNIETNTYNALGTSAEFKAMCDEAEKYGIKVIVDAVLNHTANNNGNNSISTLVPADLRNDTSCWHDITRDSWYESRWDITQFCMGGIPDLNTGNTKVQQYAISFLKECIDAGADGFRFDGAKHIEVPTDYDYASDFWPNVLGATTSYAQSTKGFTPYYYGEILDGPSGYSDKANAQTTLNSYMSYMSVTQSSVSDSIRNSVAGGNASGASRSDFYFDDGALAKGSKTVLWNESHDTYIHGGSGSISVSNMNKTWAIVGARNEASGLYMARPSSNSDMLGTAGITGWANKEVKAVNQFKNKFIGQSEYISSSGSIVINERGNSGAVLVNVGGNSTNVSVKANKLANGTYKDAITGNIFTVSGGYIKGNIGSTGIAVITSESNSGSTESGNSSVSIPETTATPTIYFDNSSYKWSKVYAYVYTDASQNATWPGKAMTLDSETGYYKLTLPSSLAYGRVIFAQSANATTKRYPADQQPGLEINAKDMIFSAKNSWKEYVVEAPQPETSSNDSGSTSQPETPSTDSGSTSQPETPSTPEVNATPTIYFDNTSYKWSKVYAYVYTDKAQNASWPGKAMTLDSSTGYYKLTLPSSLANGRVIFTQSANATTKRYPADQQPGLEINSKDMIFSANNSWKEYVAPAKTIIYFDNASYRWSKVYAYIYTDTAQNAYWPGKAMTLDSSTGYYKLEVPSQLVNGRVIFTESASATTNRYPADQQPGLEIGGTSKIFTAGKKWSELSAAVSVSATSTTVSSTSKTTTASSSQTSTGTLQKLSKYNSSIYKGRTTTAKATITGGSVTWSSSNPNVVTVAVKSTTATTSTVTLKGISVGTATVTCTHSDGTTKTIKVTVK